MNSVKQWSARPGLSGWHRLAVCMFLMLAAPFSQAALARPAEDSDPSGRVARLSFVEGEVRFQAAGESGFSEVSFNRPLVTGDRIATSRRARAALDLGGAEIRLDDGSELLIRNIDDHGTQLELLDGSANLSLRSVGSEQAYEIDTAGLALIITRAGQYRVDVDRRGGSTTVSVFSGAGTVYGANSSRYEVAARSSYRFYDSRLADVSRSGLPRDDDFDRWAAERDSRIASSRSGRYTSSEVVGLSELDDYGDWREESSYGPVWYPGRLEASWAPYRYGHWIWLAPWGWTWVDDAPWGFAPFHYGRWVYLHDNWGWLPCRREYRPVYAPALVAFVGNRNTSISIGIGGGPVGWFPLGPRDIYQPPYRASHRYFGDVNTSNSAHVDAGQMHRFDPEGGHRGRRAPPQPDYAYRNQPGAVTVVDNDAFTHARPVGDAHLRGRPEDLAHAPILRSPPAQPGDESSGLGRGRPPAEPPAQGSDRPEFGDGRRRGRGSPDENQGVPVIHGERPPNPQPPPQQNGSGIGQPPVGMPRGRPRDGGDSERPLDNNDPFRRERPTPMPSRRYTPEERQQGRDMNDGGGQSNRSFNRPLPSPPPSQQQAAPVMPPPVFQRPEPRQEPRPEPRQESRPSLPAPLAPPQTREPRPPRNIDKDPEQEPRREGRHQRE